MRHESQVTLIEKLHKLIAAVESLPEESHVTSCNAFLWDRPTIHLSNKSFQEKFSGQVVHREKDILKGVSNDVEWVSSVESFGRGPFQMPALVPQ